jgi:hypothetical protein
MAQTKIVLLEKEIKDKIKKRAANTNDSENIN